MNHNVNRGILKFNITIKNLSYEINLINMTQKNIATSKVRLIKII